MRYHVEVFVCGEDSIQTHQKFTQFKDAIRCAKQMTEAYDYVAVRSFMGTNQIAFNLIHVTPEMGYDVKLNPMGFKLHEQKQITDFVKPRKHTIKWK